MDVAARVLIIGGAIMLAGGFALLAVSRLGLGRVPGDFIYEGKNVYVAIPLATSIVLSVVLTIALNIAIRIWK